MTNNRSFPDHYLRPVLVVPLSSLPIAPAEFRANALHWAARFQYCAYYEPNDLPYPRGLFLGCWQ
ncbi:hypothetical protein H9L05_15895 [Hymenobacter qilianensis]|uniref:Uncharacterized protein n=1 Tax=Hymenobacter qilianensis TaxID=1385715 RepID=A0A7H0GT70_9BACT|nr:hypothetical protein [Hymenobacter qilianensis]QNP51486.1 hypothetical protein H9L05_15895 [Hymenobacter qilianensis]